MKYHINFIISICFIVSHCIICSNAQFSDYLNFPYSPFVKYAKSSKNNSDKTSILDNKQFKSFSFGIDKFRLAIIGDSGTEKEANEVMNLTTFDALLHLGDYDYECKPDKYFETVLDSNRRYQFMGVLGNHDAKHECSDDEAERFKRNVYNEMTNSKNSKVKCEFSESKFMWACVYKNMRIIGLTPSINGADKRKEQLEFLKKHLENAQEDWKICSWHYYDKYYHTGKYPNDGNVISGDGESFYDYCKEQGAIIFSAHDHVYARTHVMSKFSTPEIDKYDKLTNSNIVQIRKGATLNILNGTGGWEIYVEQGKQKDYSHWQKKYARGSRSENAKKYGGLFCDFNYEGNPRKAYCQFLRINSSEKVFDSFYIYRNDKPESQKYSKIDSLFLREKLIAFRNANINNEKIISEIDAILNNSDYADNSKSTDSNQDINNGNTNSNINSNHNTNISNIHGNGKGNSDTTEIKDNNKINSNNNNNNNNSNNNNNNKNSNNKNSNNKNKNNNNNIDSNVNTSTDTTTTTNNDNVSFGETTFNNTPITITNNTDTNTNTNTSTDVNTNTSTNDNTNTNDNNTNINNNNNNNSTTTENNNENKNKDSTSTISKIKEKLSMNNIKKSINVKTIAIGGSVFAAVVLLIGGLFVFRKTRKRDSIPEGMFSFNQNSSNYETNYNPQLLDNPNNQYYGTGTGNGGYIPVATNNYDQYNDGYNNTNTNNANYQEGYYNNGTLRYNYYDKNQRDGGSPEVTIFDNDYNNDYYDYATPKYNFDRY